METIPADAATFVYVGNAESQDITVFHLVANGDLRPLSTVAVLGPSKPGGSLPLAVAPDKKFLYVALRNEPYSLATFSIAPKTGKLTYVGSGPLADSMAYITTDRTGKWLLSASYGGNKVTVNPIGTGGIVGAVGQVVTGIPKAHCILPDAGNRHVLFTSLGGDQVHQMRFDAKTGTLTPNVPPSRSVAENAGPRHFVFSPDEKFVYLLNELDATVHVFPYDKAAGTLGAVAQVNLLLPQDHSDKPWSADIHLTPDGRFLYATERGTSTLTAFRVDAANGTLTKFASYVTVKQPRAFAIDPTGTYLLAVGQLSNTLRRYTIDRATGKLTEGAELPTGRNPNWIEIVTLP